MPSGAHVVFDRQSSWPEVVPPGWSGGLQYTLWIVLNINGQWHASGCIEYWRGLYESGGPVTGLRAGLVLRSDPLGSDGGPSAGAGRAGRLLRHVRRRAQQRTQQREGTLERRHRLVPLGGRQKFCVLIDGLGVRLSLGSVSDASRVSETPSQRSRLRDAVSEVSSQRRRLRGLVSETPSQRFRLRDAVSEVASQRRAFLAST